MPPRDALERGSPAPGGLGALRAGPGSARRARPCPGGPAAKPWPRKGGSRWRGWLGSPEPPACGRAAGRCGRMRGAAPRSVLRSSSSSSSTAFLPAAETARLPHRPSERAGGAAPAPPVPLVRESSSTRQQASDTHTRGVTPGAGAMRIRPPQSARARRASPLSVHPRRSSMRPRTPRARSPFVCSPPPPPAHKESDALASPRRMHPASDTALRPPPVLSAGRYLLVFKKQSVNLLKQLAELDPSSMSGPRSRGAEEEEKKKAPLCRCCRLGVPLLPGPSPPRIPSPRAAAAAAPRESQDHGREAAGGRRSREWCCRGPPAVERSSKPWMEEEEKSLLLPLPPGWAIK